MSPDQRFLLWVHVYEPHGPYAPPAEDLAAVGGGDGDPARYAGEVHAADRALAPLLADLERRSVVMAVAGDHGEILGEEPCGFQHERSSGDGVLRVPLVLVGPGVAAGVRAERVGLADVAPTLAALVGLPALPAGDGVLLGVAPGGNGGGHDVLRAESGMCEADCAPGCAPEGLLGRDRVVFGDGWRIVDRPGVGPRVSGTVAPPRSTWADLLAPLPLVTVPAGIPDPEAARRLGYVEER